jgi:hypothetical protein
MALVWCTDASRCTLLSTRMPLALQILAPPPRGDPWARHSGVRALMWRTERDERRVFDAFKRSLPKGRKTPTEKPRVGGSLGLVQPTPPPREYPLTEKHWSS